MSVSEDMKWHETFWKSCESLCVLIYFRRNLIKSFQTFHFSIFIEEKQKFHPWNIEFVFRIWFFLFAFSSEDISNMSTTAVGTTLLCFFLRRATFVKYYTSHRWKCLFWYHLHFWSCRKLNLIFSIHESPSPGICSRISDFLEKYIYVAIPRSLGRPPLVYASLPHSSWESLKAHFEASSLAFLFWCSMPKQKEQELVLSGTETWESVFCIWTGTSCISYFQDRKVRVDRVHWS